MLFDARRRELLRLSGAGIAAAATTTPMFAMSRAGVADAGGVQRGVMIFNVREFGATGDGKTVDSNAINKAIEAAAASGGGTVFFPAGSYLCFSLHLKSHIHLELTAGTAIIAADSPKPGETTGYNGGTYDTAEPNDPWEAYQDYGHNHWHNSLIWGEGIENVAITGPGLIWGRGLSKGATEVPSGPAFVAEQPGVGNKAIALKDCRNVLFRDFAILKGGHFGLLLTGVDNLTIDNLTIDTDRDGMDIDCCRNVRVSNCVVNSPWDDGICPKSSFALGYARPTENVMITNCYVTGTYQLGSVIDGTFKKFTGNEPKEWRPYHTGRIKCGTESNGGFRNITISNCVFEGCQGLALESEDGALLEDIAVTNLTMRDLITSPLFLRLGARLRGPKESTKIGTFRRVSISNVVSYNSASKLCAIASGIPQAAIEDLHIANVYLEHQGGAPASYTSLNPPEEIASYPDPAMFGPMPAQGFFFRHVKRLEVSHTEVRAMTPDPRPAFHLEDVDRADFIAVTAPSGQPAFRLKQVRDLRIRISRAADDATIPSATDQTL